jgi:hypothetical protein
MKKYLFFFLCSLFFSPVRAQIGEYRNEFAAGVNGGLMMSSVGFANYKVPQGQLMGKTFGATFRYTGEKYFKSICAIVAEVNFAEIGWQERIWDVNDEPVINVETGVAEEYSRIMNYVQVPLFARLGWGRERRGFQAFFQVGPQLGFFLSEKTEANYDLLMRNLNSRVSKVYAQETMPVENKFDYGIAAGLGLEFSRPHIGHFMVEGRYYFGLGNIYGNSKRDYFAKSNFYNIVIKATYLFDIVKSNNPKIK